MEMRRVRRMETKVRFCNEGMMVVRLRDGLRLRWRVADSDVE